MNNSPGRRLACLVLPLLLLGSACGSKSGGPAGKPDIILYLVDSLRRDHLGLYGYERDTSPNLDRFAKDAVVFDNAYTPSSWTRPAAASLLTGLLPWKHGATTLTTRIPRDVTLAAEYLLDGGYHSSIFAANANIVPLWGFDQGTDRYDDVKARTRKDRADLVVDSALSHLEQIEERPAFVYLHTNDPHGPCAPPPPFDTRWQGANPARPIMPQKIKPTTPRAVVESTVNAYDGEIAFNDEQFGRLLDWLKEEDRYDNAFVIFVADHGEEHLDHGAGGHSHTLYEELVHIPMVVKFPGNEFAGARVEGTVSLLDVLPTLLAHLGLDLPEDLDGTDLRPVIEQDSRNLRERPLFFDLDSPRNGTVNLAGGVRFQHMKYIHRTSPKEEESLFDLERDPGEKKNLMGEATIDLARELQAMLAQRRLSARPGARLRFINGPGKAALRFTGAFQTEGRFTGLQREQFENADRVEIEDEGQRLVFEVVGKNIPNPSIRKVPPVITDEDSFLFLLEPKDAKFTLVEFQCSGLDGIPLYLGGEKKPAGALPLSFTLDAPELILLDPGRIRRTTLENMADTLPGGYLMSIPLRPREEAEMDEALRDRLRELGYIK